MYFVIISEALDSEIIIDISFARHMRCLISYLHGILGTWYLIWQVFELFDILFDRYIRFLISYLQGIWSAWCLIWQVSELLHILFIGIWSAWYLFLRSILGAWYLIYRYPRWLVSYLLVSEVLDILFYRYLMCFIFC